MSDLEKWAPIMTDAEAFALYRDGARAEIEQLKKELALYKQDKQRIEADTNIITNLIQLSKDSDILLDKHPSTIKALYSAYQSIKQKLAANEKELAELKGETVTHQKTNSLIQAGACVVGHVLRKGDQLAFVVEGRCEWFDCKDWLQAMQSRTEIEGLKQQPSTAEKLSEERRAMLEDVCQNCGWRNTTSCLPDCNFARLARKEGGKE